MEWFSRNGALFANRDMDCFPYAIGIDPSVTPDRTEKVTRVLLLRSWCVIVGTHQHASVRVFEPLSLLHVVG
jgi:hypothetical protein